MDNKTILERLDDILKYSDEMNNFDDLASLLKNASKNLEADTFRTVVALVAEKLDRYSSCSAGIWLHAREIKREIKSREAFADVKSVEEQPEVTEDDLPFC